MKTARPNFSSKCLPIFCMLGPVWFLSLGFMTSCGKSTAAKGFISDANICNPIKNSEDIPVDFSKGKTALPAATGGTFIAAQLTTPEVATKNVWGIEFLLSNLAATPATLTVTPLVKRDTLNGVESFTVGPDGATATQPVMDPVELVSTSLEPAWVRGQLGSVINVKNGDAVWLVTRPTFTGEQSVAWWMSLGSGLYVAPLGTPIYGEIPGLEVIHRLVYCE